MPCPRDALLEAAAEAEERSSTRSTMRKKTRRSGTSPRGTARTRRSGTSPRKPSPAGKAGKSSPAGKASKPSRARRLSNRVSDLAGSAKKAAMTPAGKKALAGVGIAAGLATTAAIGGAMYKRRKSTPAATATELKAKIEANGGTLSWDSLTPDEKKLVGNHADNAGKLVKMAGDKFELCDAPGFFGRLFGAKPSNCAEGRMDAAPPIDNPTTAPGRAPQPQMSPAGAAAAARREAAVVSLDDELIDGTEA